MLEILQLCKRHNNLPIVADETYEHMTYPGEKFYSFGELTETVPVFLISGLSKRWLVPGKKKNTDFKLFYLNLFCVYSPRKLGWRSGWLTLVGP